MNMKTPQLKGLDFSSEEIKKNIEENGILRLSISLSTTCNLRCPFCYADAGKKSENELSLDGIFDVIKQAKKLGAKTITLVGGEPMIYPKVKEVISLINKNDMTPLIFTNGTQMTKEFAKFLYDNNASIIVKFNSLDNPEIQDEMVGGFK